MGVVRFQFSRQAGWSSGLIAYYGHSWPSHVDVVLASGLLGARSDSVGDKPPGVQLRPFHYAAWTHAEVVTLAVADPVAARFEAVLLRQIGKPYDWRAILAFAFARDWRETDSWFCSELAAWACEQSGVFPQPLDERVNKITPPDLRLVLSPWVTAVAGEAGPAGKARVIAP